MKNRSHFDRVSRKNYQVRLRANPFFKQKHHFPIKPVLAAMGCFFILLFGTIFLLSSDRFAISTINITGIEHLSRSDLENVIDAYFNEKSLLFWKKSNIFLFQPENLSNRISKYFTFADVSVSSAGKTVFLELTERTSNLIWTVGDSSYIVDLNGIIVRQYTETDSEESLPMFVDKNKVPVKIGDIVLTAEEIQGVFTFHEHLLTLGFPFTETVFDRLAGKWVSVTTVIGFSILFDPTSSIEDQTRRLETLFRTKIDDPTSLEYVDLRFGEHVYYK